jgi:hypothetical protein
MHLMSYLIKNLVSGSRDDAVAISQFVPLHAADTWVCNQESREPEDQVLSPDKLRTTECIGLVL